VKFPIHPKVGGLEVLLFPAKQKQKLPQLRTSVASNASVMANDSFVDSGVLAGLGIDKASVSPLPLGGKLQIRESFNRLDTRLCFALAREDSKLKTHLLQQRRAIEVKWGEMHTATPDKLLPTPALQSKKYSLELEIAKAQLQSHAQATRTQMEMQEALERELVRRIPGRRAEQSKEKTLLQRFSNSEFLMAYGTLAKQVYIRASVPETPYESLVVSWEKWQTCTQEAKSRFGQAWLRQYV